MINTIIGIIKSIFGFGEKIAGNKSLKIPMKEESIRSESHKDAQQDYRIEERRNKQDEINKWIGYIRTLNLPRRKRIKANRMVRNTIRAEQEINEDIVDGFAH